jgi:pimeloyl-ACP methyl ester carboxylesterase
MTSSPAVSSSAQKLSAAPRWAPLEQISLRYAVSGHRGRPLVLLHEMGGTLESWEPVLERLPADQRTIRLDMRGAGGSEKPRTDVSSDVWADDVVALLDHLGVTEPVDMAGIAIGGCIGLAIAARHPSRVHRLVPINPPTEATGRSGEVLRERAKKAAAEGMRAVVESALARSYPDHLRSDTETYVAYKARFVTNDPTSYAQIVKTLSEIDLGEAMATITCATLFVSGRDDLVRRSADIEAIAKKLDQPFREIEGGHIPSVQAPAAVADVLVEFFGLGSDDV